MIATLIIGLFVVLLAYLNGRGNLRNGLEIAFFILTVFLAIRYDWGNDYSGYLQAFNDYNRYDIGLLDYSVFTKLRSGEEGWVFLCVLFKPIGFFGMIIVLTIFENAVIFRLIKKYVSLKWYWLAVFIFVFNPALMITGASMMRQYLVVCLYIIGVEFIFRKKVFYFILIILIASKIHSSALVLFITLPLFYIKGNSKKISQKNFILLVLGYFLWQFYGAFFFEKYLGSILSIDVFSKYSYYVKNIYVSKTVGTGLGVYLFHFLFLILLYFLFNLKEDLRPFFYLFMISFLLSPLGVVVPMIGRISYYFFSFGIICYPILLSSVASKNFQLVILFCLLVLFSKVFFSFFYSEIWFEHFYTYKTIFAAQSWM